MAGAITLLSMRTALQNRGGFTSTTSADLTPTILNDFINEGVAQVWDLLKGKSDDRLVTSTTLATAVGVATVNLPATFYALRKLEIVDSSTPSGFRRLRSHDLDASHLYATLYGKAYRYRLQGSTIVLVPTPQAIESLRLWYIPLPTVLAADGDTFDGYNGYERLIYQYAWRSCLERQDLDTTNADRAIAKFEADIKAAADGRDDEPFYLDPRGSMCGDFDDWEIY